MSEHSQSGRDGKLSAAPGHDILPERAADLQHSRSDAAVMRGTPARGRLASCGQSPY